MKPRVLHLIDSFREGGSERQAVQLAQLLAQSGRYSVQVACLNLEGPLRSEVESLGVGCISEYRLNSFYDRNAIRQLRKFVRQLKEREVDILHAHDYYTNIFGMTAARFAGVPVRIAARRESAKRSAAKRLLERLAYRFSHKVIANCEEVRQQLIREGVAADKVVTIYNGLGLKRVELKAGWKREDLLSALDLPLGESQKVVTIVANLRGVKDHSTFLRAAKRVLEAVPHTAFAMAGEGPAMESVCSLTNELGLGKVAFFLGRCENIAELLAASDVCVLSSRSEGFSNSILEYMAARRPVVATDVGGAREAISHGETGYLVGAGDEKEMAERIVSLLRDPHRARAMGERGRAVIEQKFSIVRRLEATEKLYGDLLAQAKPFHLRAAKRVGQQSA